MEYVDSFWKSREPASVENSLNNTEESNRAPTNGNNFQCTFFRQPKSKYMTKNHATQSPDKNSIFFHLSDTCTDSESEFDETVKVPPCLRTLLTNGKCLYTVNGQPSQRIGKAVNSARVTFDPKLYVHSGRGMKSCLKNGSIKRKMENDFEKVGGSRKKTSSSKKKQDLKNRKHCTNFISTRFPRKYGYQTALKNKVFTGQRKQNFGAQSILRGTKRSIDPTSTLEVGESTCKRKRPVDSRVVRNKCLLKSMKKLIRAICRQEGPFEVSLQSLESIKPRNKIAKIDLVEQGNYEEPCDEQIEMCLNRIVKEPEMPKPVFKSPELEKLLNDSMHQTVKRNRTRSRTWGNIMKAKSFKLR